MSGAYRNYVVREQCSVGLRSMPIAPPRESQHACGANSANTHSPRTFTSPAVSSVAFFNRPLKHRVSRPANLKSDKTPTNRARGFTLVELVVVVLIVAILAAFAISTYSQYVRRGNRSQAEQLLQTVSTNEQQYMLDQRQFTSTLGTGGLQVSSNGWTCNAATCKNTYYSVSATVNNGATPPSFTLTADPAGTRQSVDGILTLDSTGLKQRKVGGVDQGW